MINEIRSVNHSFYHQLEKTLDERTLFFVEDTIQIQLREKETFLNAEVQ